MGSLTRSNTKRVAAALAVGASAGLAYALSEAQAYRLVERQVPIRGLREPLSVLHISDTHMLGRHHRLAGFLEGLSARLGRLPDLVIATGDLIEDDSGIDPTVEALGRLEARLGRFYVLGSHDYYRSSIKGTAGTIKALLQMEREPVIAERNDAARLEDGLRSKGWVPLLNTTAKIQHEGKTTRIAGTDDPYINRHTTDHAARGGDEELAIAAIHSPDIVSEWLLAGFDLVLAGHTHAGQVRFPLFGAALTNCSLPVALAGGLHRIGNGWLHVSPGLGTGRFTPIRFLARPEATLLELTPS